MKKKPTPKPAPKAPQLPKGLPKLGPGESLNIEKMEGGHMVTHHKKESGKGYTPPKKYILPD